MWRAKSARYAARLGKEKIKPFQKDLNENAIEHFADFEAVCAVADIVFILTVVKEPPPELFLRDPVLYESLVKNIDGTTILEGLKMTGLPAIDWHRRALLLRSFPSLKRDALSRPALVSAGRHARQTEITSTSCTRWRSTSSARCIRPSPRRSPCSICCQRLPHIPRSLSGCATPPATSSTGGCNTTTALSSTRTWSKKVLEQPHGTTALAARQPAPAALHTVHRSLLSP